MITHLELETAAHNAAKKHPRIQELVATEVLIAERWATEGFKMGYMFANEPRRRERKAKEAKDPGPPAREQRVLNNVEASRG
jgi:hypothetical protein